MNRIVKKALVVSCAMIMGINQLIPMRVFAEDYGDDSLPVNSFAEEQVSENKYVNDSLKESVSANESERDPIADTVLDDKKEDSSVSGDEAELMDVIGSEGENEEAVGVGSYGVNLAGAAYQTTINPFYARGYGGRDTDGYDGECTWYAWGRAYEKLGVSLPCRGHATNWTSEAQSAGLPTGTEARENSIMVEHYGSIGHVFFVEKVENGYAYVTEGNYIINDHGYYHEDVINLSTHTRRGWSTPMSSTDYIYLGGPVDHAPEGFLDIYSGENGELWVRGWAFDRDNMNRNLDIHIWVDDAEPIGAGVANTFRDDVNNVHGCGNYHGFDFKLETGLTGSHLIKVYALGVDGNGNNNGNNVVVVNGSRNVTFYGSVGEEMDTGAGRTIPDGDYVIKSLQAPIFQVDIAGDKVPSSNMDNIALWNTDESRVQDVFTVKYLNNGFYSIMQKDTNMAVEVFGANKAIKANVNMYEANGSVAQQWSISSEVFEGKWDAYRIKARCNGFSLDVEDGKVGSGANLQMFANQNKQRQGWVFKRYISPEEKKLKDDWVCEIDDVNKTVTLKKYKGNAQSIEIPSNIPINSGKYTVVLEGRHQLTNGTFPEGIKKIKICDGVKAAKDISYLFAGNKSLESLDISGFDTSEAENMSSLFYDCENLSELDLSKIKTKNAIKMNGMFSGCKGITNIDLSGLDTSNVTDMRLMFYGCSGVKKLDLSNFDTRKVTKMLNMFENCENLTDIDLSTFDTSNVTDMRRMFKSCKGLETLDLQTFSPSSNAIISDMFNDCTSLKTIFVKPKTNWNDFINTNSTIFNNCITLVGDIPYDPNKTSVKYAKVIGGYFTAKGSEEPVDLESVENWTSTRNDIDKTVTLIQYTGTDTSVIVPASVTIGGADYSVILQGTQDSSLTFPIGTKSVATEQGVKAAERICFLFSGNEEITSIDLSGLDTSDVIDMTGMFAGCKKLENLNLSGISTENVKYFSSMFNYCENLENIDVSKFDISHAEKIDGMFSNCGKLKTLDLTGFDVPEGTDISSMFNLCTSLKTIYVNPETDWSETVEGSAPFDGCTSLIGAIPYDSSKVSKAYAKVSGGYFTAKNIIDNPDNPDGPTESGILDGWSLTKDDYKKTVTLISYNGINTDLVIPATVKIGGEDYSVILKGIVDLYIHTFPANIKSIRIEPGVKATKYIDELFYGVKSLETADVGGLDTSNTKSMQSLFSGCKNLKTIDLSEWNTSQVQYMTHMFSGCSGLTRISFGDFNTDSVTNMNGMFSGCSELTELDLTSFNTKNVKQMGALFQNCRNLASIDLSRFNTDNATGMSSMFSGCESLTSIDLSSFNTENVKTMSYMFKECASLTSIKLGDFNNNKVTDMYEMFTDCKKLASIDLSGFKTDSVKRASHMFDGCESLTSIDLSSFNTENVTDMSIMFRGCKNLTNIDLSSFNTKNVTDMSYMFKECGSLKKLDLSSFDFLSDTNILINGMFRQCTALKTIYASPGSDWSQHTMGTYVFRQCDSLKGDISYDSSKTSSEYAKITGGYFTAKTSDDPIDLATTVTYENWNSVKNDTDRTLTLISYNGTDSSVVVPAKIKVNDLDYSTVLRGTGSYYEHTFPEGVQEVVFEDGVKAASNMKYLFTNNDNLTDIDLSGLDTGDVADMSLMFSGCRNLRKLVIRGNDTGSVEDFTGMFSNCESLRSIDLSGFNVGNANRLEGMFMNCESLETIDLSGFSVSHGADISSMFSGCTSLKTIYTKENEDWSGFVTGSSTFLECTSLEGGIRYDSSKTSKDYAKVSGGYFTAKSSGNSDIPPANVLLEDWTTNVNDEDKTITLISYTGKDTAIVVPSEVEDGDVNYSVIIQGTNDINKHTFPSETQSITIQNGVKAGKDISYLFSENEQLTTIDITGLDTSNASNMTGLFNGCKKLEKLDLSNFNTKKTTCYNIMFENCDNLEELDLSGFDFSNASSMMGMFIACDKLKTIDMSSFEIISPVEISGMFSGCTSLRTIYTGANADWSELAVGTTPFSSCISLSGAISYDPNDPYCADKKYAKVSGGYFTSKTSETPVNPPTPNPPVDPDKPVVPEDPNKLLHTVTYMNGNMMFMVQTVGDGELAVKPLDNPTKEGYSFAGWISGGELWNFTTPVTYNLVLTAKFIRDTISENKSSGSGMDPIPYLTGDNKIYLVVGQTYTLGKKGFISNNKRVATVDSKKGKITAKAAGEGEAVISDGTEKYYVIVQKPVFSAEYKKSDVMIGESRVLKLSGIDNSYSDYYPISWQSSNAKIATVNDGVVTGIAKGKVKIHAYVGGKKYTSSVNVNDMYTMPKKLSADSAIEINPLHTVRLKYDSKVFSPKNATWSGLSDNALMEITNKQGRLIGYRNKVVEINKTGKVKAIGTGTTTIDGKDINNRVVTLKISVKPVSTKGAVYLNINKTDTIKFPKVDNSKAKWLLDDREVTDNGVIRIDGKGKIKGLSVGNTKVTCAYEGFTFESFVYVENPDIVTDQKMTRNGNKLELKVPANGVYIIKLKDVYQTPLWNSKNRNIALVDENGTIYARKSGNTIISTKINGKTVKINVKVLD